MNASPLKETIGLMGEIRVCAEFLKKGFMASVTHGNAKATDILLLAPSGLFLRVEVKTSKNGKNFVTGYYPKYTDPNKPHPDLWVFYLPTIVKKSSEQESLATNGDRFFLATHQEVGLAQLQVNKGNKTLPGKGCDNIPVKNILETGFEERWSLPIDLFRTKREQFLS